ncbi:MAG: nitroreductase family protein [Clostridia bacterium]|nr:nitroreductase family protein [Clostridia bacterium]
MNFNEIAKARYSCRKYDSARAVEEEKLQAILESAVLSPSACNGQPYHITVCKGEMAQQVARSTKDMKINTFVDQAPILLVISEEPYCKMAALGAKIKHNDYRSIDIGILSAYITAEAAAQGLGTCIIGWLDSDKICKICGIEGTVRLVISLGYALDEPRPKKRKDFNDLITFKA